MASVSIGNKLKSQGKKKSNALKNTGLSKDLFQSDEKYEAQIINTLRSSIMKSSMHVSQSVESEESTRNIKISTIIIPSSSGSKMLEKHRLSFVAWN